MINEHKTGEWIFQDFEDSDNELNFKTELVLRRGLENWLFNASPKFIINFNHSITGRTKSMRHQGTRIKT